MMEVAATQGFSRNSVLRTILACFSSELEFLGTGDIARLVKVLSAKPDDPRSVTRLRVVKKSNNPHSCPLTSTQASGMHYVIAHAHTHTTYINV